MQLQLPSVSHRPESERRWGSDAVSVHPIDQGTIQIFKGTNFPCNMAFKYKPSTADAQPETVMRSNSKIK